MTDTTPTLTQDNANESTSASYKPENKIEQEQSDSGNVNYESSNPLTDDEVQEYFNKAKFLIEEYNYQELNSQESKQKLVTLSDEITDLLCEMLERGVPERLNCKPTGLLTALGFHDHKEDGALSHTHLYRLLTNAIVKNNLKPPPNILREFHTREVLQHYCDNLPLQREIFNRGMVISKGKKLSSKHLKQAMIDLDPNGKTLNDGAYALIERVNNAGFKREDRCTLAAWLASKEMLKALRAITSSSVLATEITKFMSMLTDPKFD